MLNILNQTTKLENSVFAAKYQLKRVTVVILTMRAIPQFTLP